LKTKELIDELERRIARRDEVSVESVSIKRRLDAQTVWMDAALARLRLLERAMPVLKALADENIVDDHQCLYCQANIAYGEQHVPGCAVHDTLSAYAALEGGGE